MNLSLPATSLSTRQINNEFIVIVNIHSRSFTHHFFLYFHHLLGLHACMHDEWVKDVNLFDFTFQALSVMNGLFFQEVNRTLCLYAIPFLSVVGCKQFILEAWGYANTLFPFILFSPLLLCVFSYFVMLNSFFVWTKNIFFFILFDLKHEIFKELLFLRNF